MSRILSLRDVKRTYGEPPVAACAGVSLEIDDGEFVAIVGPSGSGKSTVANIVLNLIDPTEGKVFSPVDGSITMVAETGHAIGLLSDSGTEVLIHIGIDTVTLKGAPFTVKCAAGDKVKKGALLMDVDLGAIKAANLPTTTMVVITNTDEYDSVEGQTGSDVKAGDTLISVS